MLTYLLRRLGFIILTMFLASIIIFSVTQLLPGDVAQVVLGQFATETTGLLLITFLAIGMGWLPANSSINPEATFREAFHYLILPAITVSLTSMGYIARMTRAGTIDVLRTDYVRAAYLKGLPRGQVLIRHVLRNALLPTVTVIALSIGWLLGGLIVTEAVFGYPGMGRLMIYAISSGVTCP